MRKGAEHWLVSGSGDCGYNVASCFTLLPSCLLYQDEFCQAEVGGGGGSGFLSSSLLSSVRHFVAARKKVTNTAFVTCAGTNLSGQERNQSLGPASREVKIKSKP